MRTPVPERSPAGRPAATLPRRVSLACISFAPSQSAAGAGVLETFARQLRRTRAVSRPSLLTSCSSSISERTFFLHTFTSNVLHRRDADFYNYLHYLYTNLVPLVCPSCRSATRNRRLILYLPTHTHTHPRPGVLGSYINQCVHT